MSELSPQDRRRFDDSIILGKRILHKLNELVELENLMTPRFIKEKKLLEIYGLETRASLIRFLKKHKIERESGREVRLRIDQIKKLDEAIRFPASKA